jgi:hypothetical protein
VSGKNEARIRDILATAKSLAVEYYQLTGKPLGVTGEVAEYVASQLLGLTLAPARTPGYDALRGTERIQIKGRAYGKGKSGQRLSRINPDALCDTVLVVLLDNATLEPHGMWEAPFSAVVERLKVPGSKARKRGVLGVAEFKALKLARQVWPKEQQARSRAARSSS